MEKVFARDWFSSPLPVAVARTSQSPFPLSAILYQKLVFYRKIIIVILMEKIFEIKRKEV